jgi:3-oxoacyl-[acyl-carrier-protein] synthase III
MALPTVGLIDVAAALPERQLGAAHFAALRDGADLDRELGFPPPEFRRHVVETETPGELAARAVAPLIERHGAETITGIDVLVTHTEVPSSPLYGSGAEIARRLGMRPGWVCDIRSGGCTAFLQMLSLAHTILRSSTATTALIVTVQNSAGSVFSQPEVRKLPIAAVPGDGCGVALLRREPDRGEILDIECRTYPDAADTTPGPEFDHKYWEPGDAAPLVHHAAARATRTAAPDHLPEVALAVCDRLGVGTAAVDRLITNQPSPAHLHHHREALRIPEHHHPDTYARYGDLFAAALPITLDHENRAGRIPNGSLVLLAASSGAGDHAAAAALRWGAAPEPG